MISDERFIEIFSELIELMGWRMTEKRILSIWDEMKSFDTRDIEKGIEDMKNEDRFHHKRFYEICSWHASMRRDYENHIKGLRAQEDWKRMMELNAGCEGGEICRTCVQLYCDTGTRAVLQGCALIASHKRTQQEVEEELARRFPGTGFDNVNITNKVPF